MNGFDDLFVKDEEKKDSRTIQKEDKPFDKDAWVEKKKQERADAYALIDDGTETISQDGEAFRDYLNVQARFDRYSVSNAILIAHQMPEATRLADFDSWKNNDVSLKKGETAITILEPGNEYTREDGTTGFSVNVKARQSYHSALPSNDVDRTGNTACTPSGICTVASSSCHLAEDWSLNL